MKNKKRALLVILAATMLLASTVMGTMAWLYDTDTPDVGDQTFDAGELGVTIDYTNYFATSNLASEDEVDNELIPGRTYDLAPTVTIADNSEDAYVRVFVTITDAKDLIELLGVNIVGNSAYDILIPHQFVGDTWDASKWTCAPITTQDDIDAVYDVAADTLTYEFRYSEIVKAEDTDSVLPVVFGSFTLPGKLTNADVEKIAQMTISFEAQAIQAKYIGTADQAWAQFDALNYQ